MKLLALKCPACGNALAPNDDDLVIACSQCGAASAITDEGLQPIEVRYAAGGTDQRRPWWVFEGRVQLMRRETQGGNRREEAQAFWSEPRSFYVPAWELSLQSLKSNGLDMLKQQPHLQAGARPDQVKLSPVVVSAEDARRMIEFLVLSLEAGRSDELKSIDFKIEVNEPVLWGLAW